MRQLLVIALVAACGDDGVDPNSCQPDGMAWGEGVVGSESLGPWLRAGQFPVGTMHAIALDEVAGACGEVATTGKHLVFLMCEPPEERNYRITTEQAFRCPSNDVHAVIERGGSGADVAASITGTLMITSAAGCVFGTYALTLDTFDDIEGSFDAVVCN